MKNEVEIGPESQHFPKLWDIHSLGATLWYTKMIITLPRSFWYLIWMIWQFLAQLNLEYVILPKLRRPKTQIRRFLEIWQEPGLGTKLKICAKGYITIIKHNIEGTFHGQIQPISWRTSMNKFVTNKSNMPQYGEQVFPYIGGDWLSCDPLRGSHDSQSPHIRT